MRLKKYIYSYIIIFFILNIGFIFTTNIIKGVILDNIINTNARLITNIIDNNISEDTLIDSIINTDTNINKGMDILAKYGLDKRENIVYIKSITSLDKKITTLNYMFFIATFILMLVVFIVYYIINNRKIKELNSYLIDLVNEKYNMKVIKSNESYISMLYTNIYKLATKLQQNKKQLEKDKLYLKESLTDISHQLKTPLTSLILINEILKDNDLPIEKRTKFINDQDSMLTRASFLIASLLKLSKLDSGTIVFKKNKLYIKDIINKLLLEFDVMLKDKNINYEVNINDGDYIIGDFDWTLEALSNILKNGIEYTNNNGLIKIYSDSNPIYTSITIMDNGIGIDEKVLPNIFKRFYKVGTNKNSVGVGLNLSKTIIEKLNGIIEVTSKKGEFTKFIIKFYDK